MKSRAHSLQASQMSEAEIRESIREPLKKMKEFYSLSSDGKPYIE